MEDVMRGDQWVQFSQGKTQQPIWLNPTLVRVIETVPEADMTRLYFDKEHSIMVNGTPKEIADLLREAMSG
jgi:hypothetical protein